MIFDPILDKQVKMTYPKATDCKALWIWYPGQRIAHLHKAKLKASQERFKYVGYPGTFRQPRYVTHFRRFIELSHRQKVRWQGMGGRMRVTIDGDELDITSRTTELSSGYHTIVVTIDFTDTLPCFYFISDELLSDDQWEVSLNRKNWHSAVCSEKFNQIDIFPLSDREAMAEIPPLSIITLDDMSQIIDFGYYELGSVACRAKGNGEITILVGQSLEEVLETDLELLEQRQCEPVCVQSEWRTYTSSIQACRYARIMISGEIETAPPVFKAKVWPVTYEGSFESDDQQLNDCWSIGTATVHSCMHEFYLDAIYRDGLPWALDGLCAMETASYIFQDEVMAHQHIISQMLPLSGDMSDLGGLYLDFQLHTLLGIENNYLLRKNRAFLLSCKPVIDHTLGIYMDLQDEKGFVSAGKFKGAHFFPDWAVNDVIGPDVYGTPSYVQMMLMHCFEFGAYVSDLVEEPMNSKQYRAESERLRENIVENFYESQEGVFINGLLKTGETDNRVTIFSQVFAVLYDLIPKKDYGNLARSLKNEYVKRHPSLSLNYYFELQALCKMGLTDIALESIRRHIGGIVNVGDLRVYEDINISGERTLDFYGRKYGKSLCHAVIGAAPVIALSKYVTGIEPILEEGLGYTFNPRNNELHFVKGSIATPKGAIKVFYNKDEMTITIPKGIEIRLIGVETQEGLTQLSTEGVFELRRIHV